MNAGGIKYLVVLANDFVLSDGWVDAVEKELQVMVIRPGMVDDDQVEMALTDDSVSTELLLYKNLKVIFSISAGIENLQRITLLHQIPVIRLVNAEMVSLMCEYVCYFALQLHRGFREIETDQREKTWKWYPPQQSAKACNVTVLGLGNLGLPAAKSLSALGFNTAGWSRSPKIVPGLNCHSGPAELDALLMKTNILVNILPSTPETTGLLNGGFFRKLPAGTNIINVGRGDCLAEADLIAALDTGHLNHAVLDVFREEPLPQDSPVWGHHKITITPHLAAYPEPEGFYKAIEEAIGNFKGSL